MGYTLFLWKELLLKLFNMGYPMNRYIIIIFLLAVTFIVQCGEEPIKPNPRFFLITNGFGIQWSKLDRRRSTPSNKPWVFYEWSMKIQLNKGERVFISSTPDGKGFIVVDDGLYVNGRKLSNLYNGLYGDARENIGRSATVSYKPIEPIEITKDIRMDGLIHIQLIDWGILYASSPLYLVIQ